MNTEEQPPSRSFIDVCKAVKATIPKDELHQSKHELLRWLLTDAAYKAPEAEQADLWVPLNKWCNDFLDGEAPLTTPWKLKMIEALTGKAPAECLGSRRVLLAKVQDASARSGAQFSFTNGAEEYSWDVTARDGVTIKGVAHDGEHALRLILAELERKPSVFSADGALLPPDIVSTRHDLAEFEKLTEANNQTYMVAEGATVLQDGTTIDPDEYYRRLRAKADADARKPSSDLILPDAIEYLSQQGVTFRCAARNLAGGVEIHDAMGISPCTLASEVAEFMGWFMAEVYPSLTWFQGCDTVRFELVHADEASPLVQRARAFAIEAHGDQVSKYTEDPYWHHLRDVAGRVALLTDDEEVIAAAWLHDVIEDTDVDVPTLRAEFGDRVARLVICLTDVFTHEDYPHRNRAWRKRAEAQRLGSAPHNVRLIKICDIQSNAESIEEHGGDFIPVWKAEKGALLWELLHSDALRSAKRVPAELVEAIAMGEYGRVMQLTSTAWRKYLSELGMAGGEFAVGVCQATLERRGFSTSMELLEAYDALLAGAADGGE